MDGQAEAWRDFSSCQMVPAINTSVANREMNEERRVGTVFLFEFRLSLEKKK